MRMVRHLRRLPSEVVDAPSLEMITAPLDGTLSNLVECRVSLPMTERL